jgi:hypothetical protein
VEGDGFLFVDEEVVVEEREEGAEVAPVEMEAGVVVAGALDVEAELVLFGTGEEGEVGEAQAQGVVAAVEAVVVAFRGAGAGSSASAWH